MNAISTALLAIIVVVYILYRQCVKRPVTRRDLLVPAIGALYIASSYLGSAATATATAVVLAAAALGIGIGFVSGALVQVWRDGESGLVYQYGGWRYAGVIVALIVIRVLARIVLAHSGIAVGMTVLNDAFIAMAIGALFGRTLNIGLRTMILLGWQVEALPGRRTLRQGVPR